MTYEETLEKALREYPSLFLNEHDFLRHVFSVNGNGYDWQKDGSLESFDYGEKKEVYTDEQIAIIKAGQEKYHREIAEKNSHGDRHRCWFICRDGSVGAYLYPLCEYARIVTFPDNIREDWLAALEKSLELFYKDRPTKKDKFYLAMVKTRVKTIKKLRNLK